MKIKCLFTILLGFLLTIGLVYSAPQDQKAANDSNAGLKRLADRGRLITSHIPAHIQRAISAGGQRLIDFKNRFENLPKKYQNGNLSVSQANLGGSKPPKFKRGPVSDPNAPLELASRLFGFTQSETSAAWCGINALAAYNDSGSLLEQLLVSPSQSFSLNGYGRSTDEGKTFTDEGFLNSDPIPTGFEFYDLFGDGVARCTSKDTFYIASLAAGTNITTLVFTSDISVSKSTDAGDTFAGPVPAASKDATTHFLDKPWFATDPTNANNLYVTYTDFDFSGDPPCQVEGVRAAIEVVRSTDAGATWSSPVVIKEVCGNGAVQGSNVVVDGAAAVYVGYEDLGDAFPVSPRSFHLRKSTDGGVTFGADVPVTDITYIGDSFEIQGGARHFIDTPGTGLAVDRSGGTFNGRVYVCWQDGRNFSQPIALASFVGLPTDQYNFGDILVTHSDDGGATWSAPVRVNDDTTGPQDIDQFQSSVAVDKFGTVGVFFYDRRDDPRNFLIGVTFASSKDGGLTFKNDQILKGGFASVIAQDFLLNPAYMGDYDALTDDFLQITKGFIVPYADNLHGDPNVRAVRKIKN